MNTKIIRSALRLLAATLATTALFGCASMAIDPAGGGTASSAQATQTGGGGSSNYRGSADASSGAYNPGSAGPAKQGGTGSGGAANAEDSGIGLKPGGAQDIAFFRSKLNAKQLPKATDMTLEGFLNEHDTMLPPASKDRVVSLHALGAAFQPAGGKPEAVIQIGLNSHKKLDDVQTSLALTVVIDRSGSMSGNKMTDVKAGLHEMVNHLPKGTRLGIVSFSSDVKTDYAPAIVGPDEAQKVHNVIDALVANGGTNIHGGMQEGHKHCFGAGAAFQNKRILFLSDGVATAGNTSAAAIVSLVKAAAAEGCSVSTVGVGFDFDVKLMTEMAQVGNGTAWFVQNSDHAKAVFVQDLETMLLPVAEKLWMKFSIGEGWKVQDIPGFEWVTEGKTVTITGTKKATQTTEPGKPDPGTNPDPNAGKVAMPTLFASKKNGIVMVRLQPPADLKPEAFQGLLLSTVQYGYSIAKTGASESYSVPVQVPGLFGIPDGGLAYFASPIVRRTFVVLHTGIDLFDACKLVEAGQKEAALAVLDAAVKRVDTQLAEGGAELATVDKFQPNLADAKALLGQLKALIP
ncbi:MAG: VWA domain-containing protein [Deltaproteobacteria bacterium]|nr:VWA domain-containing protein [Deltaproteobacteria bacterium]